jgi:hypothetical protein
MTWGLNRFFPAGTFFSLVNHRITQSSNFLLLDDARPKLYLTFEEKMSEAQKQARLTAFAHSGG